MAQPQHVTPTQTIDHMAFLVVYASHITRVYEKVCTETTNKGSALQRHEVIGWVLI